MKSENLGFSIYDERGQTLKSSDLEDLKWKFKILIDQSWSGIFGLRKFLVT